MLFGFVFFKVEYALLKCPSFFNILYKCEDKCVRSGAAHVESRAAGPARFSSWNKARRRFFFRYSCTYNHVSGLKIFLKNKMQSKVWNGTKWLTMWRAAAWSGLMVCWKTALTADPDVWPGSTKKTKTDLLFQRLGVYVTLKLNCSYYSWAQAFLLTHLTLLVA